MKISREECIAILNEKDKYEKIKFILRSENEKYKITRRLKWKIIEHFMSSKKVIFFLCMYKMVDISVETCNKADVSVTNIH